MQEEIYFQVLSACPHGVRASKFLSEFRVCFIFIFNFVIYTDLSKCDSLLLVIPTFNLLEYILHCIMSVTC